MKTIDIERLYSELTSEFSGGQRKLDLLAPIGVYYGLSPEGYLRLAFRSVNPSPKMESTQMIRVTQGVESPGVCWTCFDLKNHEAKQVFCSFCSNIIDSIKNTGNETIAFSKLKNRFVIWKSLFKKDTSDNVPWELVQGLFGELYFLNDYMLQHYEPQQSIISWSGPDFTSKDYSLDNKWYEVKTIGANANHIRISSIAQLTSSRPGMLAVIRVERMSPEFSNGKSSILELFRTIMNRLSDEGLEDIFASKVASFGINLTDAAFSAKYDVKEMKLYRVDSEFPRITIDNVPFPEISGVAYDISLAGIKRFLED